MMRRYGIFLVASFILLFSFVSAFDLSNITLEQQNSVCNVLNLTFIDCYDLWQIVENYENNTIYINSTSNCSNFTEYVNITSNCSVSYVDELNKIDEYKKRGFEPVFQDGIIVNFQKERNESCEAFDCTDQCTKAVEEVKAQQDVSEPVVQQNNNVIFIYFLVGIFVLVALYFLGKKFMRGGFSSQNIYKEPPKPPEPLMDYEHKVPKLSEDNPIQDRELREVSDDDAF